MKYTPGPWEATPGEVVNVENSGRMVCDLRNSPLVKDIPYNSLLIAAAPDLWEACNNTVKVAEFQGWGEVAWVKRVKNAISKAEGKE